MTSSSSSGRLIKKKDKKSFENVECEAYPWLQFSDKNVVFPDNSRKSVLLTSNHDPVQMGNSVREAHEFNKQLGAKSEPLYPIDLTHDYYANQEELIIRRRKRLLDEDDSDVYDIGDLTLLEQVSENHSSWKKGKGKIPVPSEQKQEEVIQKSGRLSEETKEPEKKSPPPEKPRPAEKVVFVNEPPAPVLQEQNSLLSDEEIEEIKNKAWDESYTAGYLEGHTEGKSAGLQEGHDEGVQSGFASAFQQGHSEGEERGLAVMETQAQLQGELLRKILSEISNAKHELFDAGKEIFVEIIKICSEKILRHEIAIRDESLFAIFNSIVKDYPGNDRIDIEVNPADGARIQKAFSKQENIFLKINSQLSEGEFKVHAGNEVSSFDLTKAVDKCVSDLLKDVFSQPQQSSKKEAS